MSKLPIPRCNLKNNPNKFLVDKLTIQKIKLKIAFMKKTLLSKVKKLSHKLLVRIKS